MKTRNQDSNGTHSNHIHNEVQARGGSPSLLVGQMRCHLLFGKKGGAPGPTPPKMRGPPDFKRKTKGKEVEKKIVDIVKCSPLLSDNQGHVSLPDSHLTT